MSLGQVFCHQGGQFFSDRNISEVGMQCSFETFRKLNLIFIFYFFFIINDEII